MISLLYFPSTAGLLRGLLLLKKALRRNKMGKNAQFKISKVIPFDVSGSRESSPSVSESSIAEDDIPPEMYVPNQQMWLKLRLRQNTLGFSPCC